MLMLFLKPRVEGGEKEKKTRVCSLFVSLPASVESLRE